MGCTFPLTRPAAGLWQTTWGALSAVFRTQDAGGGGGDPEPEDGDATILSSRTTAHRDRNTNSAAFGVCCPTIPTGKAFSNVYYYWTWTDAAGSHSKMGCAALIDVKGDGSASYACTVKLWIIDGATLATLNLDGTAREGGASGTLELTVTSNAAATVFSVTKTGDAITATAGGTTYNANESTGNDATGDGTIGAPYRTLSRMITARKASNQVWSLGAGAYAAGASLDISGVSNLEISAASGQTNATVSLVAGHDGYWFIGGSSPVDHRIVGITLDRSARGYNAGANLYDSNVATICTDLTIRGTVAGHLYGGVINAYNDGCYLIGNDWSVGSATYFASGRSQFVHLEDNTLTSVAYVGAAHENLNRYYNHRYSSFNNNTMVQNLGEKACIRQIATFGVSESEYWDDGDGYSTSSWVAITNNSMRCPLGNTSGTPLAISYDQDAPAGSTRQRYIDLDGNTITSPSGSSAIDVKPEITQVTDINIRNNRFGEDGLSVDAGVVRGVQMTRNSTNSRLRFNIEGNDFVAILNSSTWTGSQYAGSALFECAADVTGNAFNGNLLMFNIYNPGGEGNLAFNGARADIAGSWTMQRNTYVKTDTHGSSSDTQTAFVGDFSGSRTRATWLAAGVESNSQGLDIADATLRSTHYDFTAYRTRDNADWESDWPRNAACAFDSRGYARHANSTPGRYDPNGTVFTPS